MSARLQIRQNNIPGGKLPKDLSNGTWVAHHAWQYKVVGAKQAEIYWLFIKG
jgi:hypothetical protein